MSKDRDEQIKNQTCRHVTIALDKKKIIGKKMVQDKTNIKQLITKRKKKNQV